MKRKAILKFVMYIILMIIFVLLVGVALLFFFGNVLGVNNSLLNVFLSAFFTVAITIGFIVPKGVRRELEKLYENYVVVDDSKCRIFIFGLGGTGKTTFIKKLLYNDISPSSKTEHYESYLERIPYSLTKRKALNVEVIDYQGQQPGQVLLNLDETFFGDHDNRLINAVLFVVDLFQDDQWTEEHKNDGVKLIRDRVNEQMQEIPDIIINLILDATFNLEETHYVRLLINKLDLLRDLVALGYIPEVSNATDETVRHYAKKLYAGLEERIREGLIRQALKYEEDDELQARQKIQLIFDVEVISAKDGIDKIKSGIFSTYLREHD